MKRGRKKSALKILGFAKISPQTPRVLWKIAEPLKYRLGFSKEGSAESNNFLRFWIFSLGLSENFFIDFFPKIFS